MREKTEDAPQITTAMNSQQSTSLHLGAGTASVGKVDTTLQKEPAALSLHKIQDVLLLPYIELSLEIPIKEFSNSRSACDKD